MTIEWPIAQDVARAIVTAARLEDDDPILVAEGGYAPRSRIYAFLALCLRFGGAPRDRLAHMVGWRRPSPFQAIASQAARGSNKQTWFDLSRLNEVSAACGWTAIDDCEAAAVATWKPAAEPKPEPAAVPSEPVEEASASDSERKARVERMKAFAAGEPTIVADRPGKPAAPTEPAETGAKYSVPIPKPLKKPLAPKVGLPALIPSKAARDLAILTRARRAPVRHEPDLTVSYSPDAPAVERGCELHTAALMGDPAPARSALNHQHEQTIDRRARQIDPVAAKPLRHPDEIFVERWQGEQAQQRIDERAKAQAE